MCEAKPSQRQGVYAVWPRRRHSAEIRVLALRVTGKISDYFQYSLTGDAGWY